MIKIPATRAGLPAITEVVGAGISVNVTLIFSLERYREVMDAYLAGLEKAQAAGLDLAGIHSVASFFVSRVDSEIDKRLTVLGTDEALALKGKAALANARLAYEAYENVFAGDRFTASPGPGRTPSVPCGRRPGEGPGIPGHPVRGGAGRSRTVNTMPEATLNAAADHGDVRGDTVTGGYAQARADLAAVERLGISYDEVVEQLEQEGVAKFEVAWQDLLDAVTKSLDSKGVDGE